MPKTLAVALKFCAASIFTLSCAAIAVHAFNYLSVQFNPNHPFHVSFARIGWAVPAHFYAGGMALLITPLQLSSWLRQRWPAIHRSVGWIYLSTALIGGVSGVIMSFHAQGGWSTGASFLISALLWLLTTAVAVSHAVRGQIAAHRRWMLRSVALVYSAVTLRIYLGLGLGVLQLPFEQVYLFAAWCGWVVNLLAVEAYLRWRPLPGRNRVIAPPVAGTGSASAPQSA